MSEILSVLKESLMITTFVFVMMLIVDYFNVITAGRLSSVMKGSPWRQYVASSFFGATPGCLGAFMDVSFYVHGLLTFGAIVGGMIATSGDEAFVMLALFPMKALFIFALLMVMGIAFGFLADKIALLLKIVPCQECRLQQVHTIDVHKPLDKNELSRSLFNISFQRAVLLLGTVTFLVLLTTGIVGPLSWNWEKITLVALIAIAIIIIGSTPDHYIKEHIWAHIAKKHLWRVFLWSFFAILVVNIGLEKWNLEVFVKTHMAWVLLVSALVGVIPESGPHMIFVIMFAHGHIPFSVLLTSSFVQDGHGMLPLLSYTVKDSILIKLFNFVFGLLVGGLLFAFGG